MSQNIFMPPPGFGFTQVRKDLTPSDLHVNQLLTNVMLVYWQKETDFCAGKIFPSVPVQKQSDRYTVIPKGALFRSMAQPRAPHSETPGISYDVDTTPTYYCDVYGIHKDIDDQERANRDNPILDPDKGATGLVTQQLLLYKEQKFITNFMTTGKWTTEWTGSAFGGGGNFTFWSDYTNSDPIANIDSLRGTIRQQTSKMPNKLTLSYDTYLVLKNHPKVIERIKYTQRGIITPEILASLFDIEEIVVISSVQNIGKKGKADNMQFFASNCALLTYTTKAPSIDEPSAGYTFTWVGYLGATPEGTRIKKYRIEQISSDRVEGEAAIDMKITGQDLGAFLNRTII